MKKSLKMKGLSTLRLENKLKKQDIKDYGPPNFLEAKQYGEFKSCRMVNPYNPNKLMQIPLCHNLSVLAQFGAGLQMYFMLIKYFAVLFFVFFIISSYSLF